MKVKKSIFSISNIRYIGLILIIALGVYYFYWKGNELSQLKYLTLTQIGTASIAILLYQFIGGVKYKIIFSAFQIKLSIKEWFGLPQVIKLFNLLFFKSGTISNAYYLKKHHQLSYSRFIVAMSVQKILDLFVVVSIGFIFSLVFFIYFEINFYIVLIFCFLLTVILCFFFYPPIHMEKRESRILKKISEIIESWNEYKQNKPVILKVVLLEIIAVPVLGLRYYIAFNILNNPVSIAECVIFSVVVSATGFVSIIPGNIGIKETIVGLSAYYMDYSFEYGVIATALDRVISTVWTGIFGFIFFHLLHLKGYSKKNMPAL